MLSRFLGFRKLLVPLTNLLTIGNFDGIHFGHQKLISKLKSIHESIHNSKSGPAMLSVLTFEPHPIEVLRPGIEVERLTPPGMKTSILLECGIDNVFAENFDLDLAAMSPENFFHKILIEKYNAHHIVVGENFKFGKSQAGDVATLQTLGQAAGVQIHVVPRLLMDGEPVSSSRIRKALSNGDLPLAERLMGRPHQLLGTVVHGAKRGSQIGVPTANLKTTSACKKSLVPKSGVYVTRTSVEGPKGLNAAPSVTNIGVRPTVDPNSSISSIETHILPDSLNPVGDLYGKMMSVEFLYRIRDEIRFSSINELVKQIQSDIEFSRSYLQQI